MMITEVLETCRDLEYTYTEKEMYVKLAIYKNYTEVDGQQNIKFYFYTADSDIFYTADSDIFSQHTGIGCSVPITMVTRRHQKCFALRTFPFFFCLDFGDAIRQKALAIEALGSRVLA